MDLTTTGDWKHVASKSGEVSVMRDGIVMMLELFVGKEAFLHLVRIYSSAV